MTREENNDKSPLQIFQSSLDGNVSTGIAAIQGLMQVLHHCQAKTLQELVVLLKAETEKFKKIESCAVIAVTSASELFVRFITLAHTQLETQDFATCLQLMQDRGTSFLSKLKGARQKVADNFRPFVDEGGNLLVHGTSQTVVSALLTVARSGREFHVYLTRSAASLKKQLEAEHISCTTIDDMAIGYIMNKVDCVLFGAEGVCESGGIVNQLGSLSIAIIAKQFNKPVYTLAESFKFVRFYPLGQDDLPLEVAHSRTGDDCELQPRVDYTPPQHLTLLFTDLGILTPSAVSDELIKLYL